MRVRCVTVQPSQESAHSNCIVPLTSATSLLEPPCNSDMS
jgi:hypothetical protein